MEGLVAVRPSAVTTNVAGYWPETVMVNHVYQQRLLWSGQKCFRKVLAGQSEATY